MVSKVCSRSHGHPPGPRNRAMIDTARSNRSPVVGIATNVNDAMWFSLFAVECSIQKCGIVGNQSVDAPFGKLQHLILGVHRPRRDLAAEPMRFVDQFLLDKTIAGENSLDRDISPNWECVIAFTDVSEGQAAVDIVQPD